MGRAEAVSGRRRVLLDVDTGVDDALALMLALRSPELEVVGVTTVCGNAPVARSTANTLLVLEVLDAPAIPVVTGAAAPLSRPLVTASEVHGADGLGNVSDAYPVPTRRAAEGAAEFLLELIRRFPDELTLIATGPLTNVATAIQRDGATMRRLQGLTVMGGAVRVPGNLGPVTEFNFGVDPEAAAIVLGAGLDPTLVPLDATEQVILRREVVDKAGGRLGGFIRTMTAAAMAFHREQEGFDGMFLHDPLAVGIVLDPSLACGQPMNLAVECRGELTAGMAVADLRRRSRLRPAATVCVEVAAARFLELFGHRVLH
ncbi:MAG TPA: nucleoside hydrolase [Candidatus Methylomirabilis sp.]|nr:nucleoside hydrolase [Candidatus Methylomirabilis sp.]